MNFRFCILRLLHCNQIMTVPRLILMLVFLDCAFAHGQSDWLAPVPPVSQATSTGIADELNSGREAARADAERQIRVLFSKGNMPFALWRTWLPMLVNSGHFQDVADLSIEAAVAHPVVETIVPVLEFRVKALLALNKNADALQAAKSYYNVCALKDTGTALDLVCICLTTKDQVLSFRAEQAAASSAAANSGSNAPASSFLNSVKVDQQPYQKALEERSSHRLSTGYANLLLAADHPHDAEMIYCELFKSASTSADLTVAIEGIARSLRAEDGNVARADAWLLALQRGNSPSTTQPAN